MNNYRTNLVLKILVFCIILQSFCLGQNVIKIDPGPLGYQIGSKVDNLIVKGSKVQVNYVFEASGKLLCFTLIIPSKDYQIIWSAIVDGGSVIATRKQWSIPMDKARNITIEGLGVLALVDVVRIKLTSNEDESVIGKDNKENLRYFYEFIKKKYSPG